MTDGQREAAVHDLEAEPGEGEEGVVEVARVEGLNGAARHGDRLVHGHAADAALLGVLEDRVRGRLVRAPGRGGA